jgi:hypothetical protein
MKRLLLVTLFLLAGLLSPQVYAGIISVNLAGPSCITCPPDGNSATYTVTVTGTPSNHTQNYFWKVFDDDLIFDDLLKDLDGFQILPGLDNWTKMLTFVLECKNGCIVNGPDGSSGEHTAEVYVEISKATSVVATSNTLDVSCCPEPNILALFGLGALGVVSARKAKANKGSGIA